MIIQGYKIELQRLNAALGGGFIAFAPDLRGCVSDGETPAIALLNLEDAIERLRRKTDPVVLNG